MTATVEPETDKEKILAASTTDWLAAVRKRGAATAANPSTPAAPQTPALAAPQTPAPGTPVPVAASAPAPAAAAAAKEPAVAAADPDEACSDDEHDLNSVSGCANWMLCMFAATRRSKLRPLAEFYLQNTIVPKTSKANPLYCEFTKAVVNGKLLHSKASRDMWISATESNRKLRFAKVPKKDKA